MKTSIRTETRRKLLSLLLALMLVLGMFPQMAFADTAEEGLTTLSDQETPGVPPSAAQVKDVLDATVAHQAEATKAEPGYEWALLALARSGNIPNTSIAGYLENLGAKLTASNGVLAGNSSEYSRTIITLSSFGVDAHDVAGYNLLAPLAEYENVTEQGITGPVYALIALNSRGYQIPSLSAGSSYTQTSEANLLSAILDSELSVGGWNFGFGDALDPDMTSMALQALAPYYLKGVSFVDGAVNRALDALGKEQDADGGFSSWGFVSPESSSQVIVALNALGIPLDDARFTKGGKTVYDNLLSYYLPGQGAFKHDAAGDADILATEQAAYALASLYRALTDKSSLYDMSDVAAYTSDTKKADEDGSTQGVTGAEAPADDSGIPNTQKQNPILLILGVALVALVAFGGGMGLGIVIGRRTPKSKG